MSFCRSAARAFCTRLVVLGAGLLWSGSAAAAEPAPAATSTPNDEAIQETAEPAPNSAAGAPSDAAPGPRELDEAREHFEIALESYSQGRYRAAIEELEKARELDPNGKDLVYNLALVHEKLGELSEALAYFEQYLTMETDEHERARVEASIVRLRGALREAEREADALSRSWQPPPPPKPAEVRHGVLDGWVWASGGLAATALVVGTVLGLRALALEPGRDEPTGDGRTVDDVRDDSQRAHDSAVAADIAFAVSLTSGAAAGLLYFGRVLPEPETRVGHPSPRGARACIDLGVRF